jgi:hypothetical protein
MKAQRRDAQAGWFVAVEFTASDRILHAKTMGTLDTACGRLAVTWPKLWTEGPFARHRGNVCAACAEVVDEVRSTSGSRAVRATH